jgi:hypothetical protein
LRKLAKVNLNASNIIECLTDNRDDTRILIPLIGNQTDSYDQSITNTEESKLMVANEKSPFIAGNRINLGSQDNSEHIDIYFSCHERMVNGDYQDNSEQTVFKGNLLNFIII